MSTYDDASLVMIPSGYKTGTVFSQKPMSTDGQLTFTRSNDTATRVASNGLIEKVRTNLVLQSETFETTWSPQIVTISANATTAPNGTLTADKLVAAVGAGTSVQHRVDQTTTSAIGVNTFSVYGKKSEIDIIQLRIGVNGAGFDLTSGTTGGAAAGVTSSILNAGNGWYRCSITFTSVAANEIVRINLATTLSPPSSFIGDGVSGAFIWGAQLETGDIATDYIPTTTAAVSVGPVANVPRLDYLGSTCPRLLLEPQRTNLMTFSEQFDNAAYSKLNTTVTSNATTSPTGYQDADKIIANTTNGVHNVSQSFSIGSSTAYTASIYAKKGEYSGLRINFTSSANTFVSVNLNTGVIQSFGGSIYLSSSITSVGNDWYRVTMSFLPPIVSSSLNFIIENPVGTVSFAGDNTSGIFLWGAQLEVGSYPTSYIPTLAASVTRGADACSKTGISSLIGQTQGTIFAEINVAKLLGIQSRYILVISDNTANNRIYIAFSGSSSNILRARIFSSGVQQASIDTGTISSLGTYKLALAYNNNDAVLYVNGVQIGTDTSVTIPACSQLNVCANQAGASPFDDGINQALLFKTRLSNSELASLTA